MAPISNLTSCLIGVRFCAFLHTVLAASNVMSVLFFTHFKMLSDFLFDFFFDSWATSKCVTVFPNI